MTSLAIAGVVGGPVPGFTMSGTEGVRHLANWQWLFLLEGILSVVAGFVAPYMIGWLKTSTGHLSAGLYFVAVLELGAAVLVTLGTRKQ